MPHENVGEIMTPNPQCCVPQDTVTAAAALMAAGAFGAVPVIDPQSRGLVGIVTDRDITCRITAKGLDPTHTTVRQAMSPDVATMGPDANIHACAHLMSERQIRRVPVIDPQGRVIGIVAQADLARMSAHETEMEHEFAEMVEEVSEPAHLARAL
jgi:CBS domain-containing protein